MSKEYSALETQFLSTKSVTGTAEDQAQLETEDLGFDGEVSRKTRRRFLNRDGSFNAHRTGTNPLRSGSLYHYCLNVSWVKFSLWIAVCYLSINLIFASIYFLCGPQTLNGSVAVTSLDRFLECFFFSVQTLSTVGYGALSPASISANIGVTTEVLIGLLGFALATGLFFARFSRPTARILFSRQALVAPYRDGMAFEFRIANARHNQLIHVEARLVMSRLEMKGSNIQRKFYDLPLERSQAMFLPLHWTIVHSIDEQSPLAGVTEQHLKITDAEFLVLLTATDDTFSQVVHAWSSYKYDEIKWGAKFSNILEEREDGSVEVDLRKLHDIEAV